MAGCSHCASDPGMGQGRFDVRFRRVLWIALLANAAMFAVEMVASLFSGSVSLAADAVDFFGDAANYGISLFVLGMGAVTRARAALFKGATMAAFGVYVIIAALYRALMGEAPDALIMGYTGLLALAVNLGVAVMLFRYRSGDSNRRSIWLCSRNDAIANVAVLVAASGVFATASGWPDIVVAAFIALLNLVAAWTIVRQAQQEINQAQATSIA